MTAPRVRIGLIGYGQMGRIHAYAYRALPIFSDPLPAAPVLQAVADVVPGAAERAAAQAGFAWHTQDWRRVVESPDVDAIDICTPNSEHLPVLDAAIAAGKHLYCEKPLCTGLDDARRVLAAARRAGIARVRKGRAAAGERTAAQAWAQPCQALPGVRDRLAPRPRGNGPSGRGRRPGRSLATAPTRRAPTPPPRQTRAAAPG